MESLAKQSGFGQAFVRGARETKDQNGNTVYIMDNGGAGSQIRRGDIIQFVDEFIFVYSKEGIFQAALNADGTKNITASGNSQGRELNVSGILADSHSSGNNDSSKPNIGKGLATEQKSELGGSSSGAPGGWEPDDEENGRNQQNQTQNFDNKFRKEDLTSSANKPINNQGLSAAARAWEKHAGRPGGVFEPLKGNTAQKNEAASNFVNEVLNNKGTVTTDLSRGGVEYRLPNGKGIRYNSDGSFSGFLDPKR
ncbi:hypothetical protein NBG80_16900 [Proteus faecis]|nr:hypothetical protein [Proteus faecis]